MANCGNGKKAPSGLCNEPMGDIMEYLILVIKKPQPRVLNKRIYNIKLNNSKTLS